MPDLSAAVHEAAAKHSDPLFLSGPWLQGGHTSQKPNGTITYIQFGANVYGVTCAHVYDQQFAVEPNLWLTVHGKQRYIYHLGTPAVDGYKSSLKPLRTPEERHGPDIAILRLDDAFKEIHLARRGKAAINLDKWAEPAWSELKVPVAFGYPTEHKIDTEEFLQAPFAAVAAELASPISPGRSSFLMASSLESENSLFFSGMSGGAVYAVAESDPLLTLVGIVFEGFPGSSRELESRTEDSFSTRNDVRICAHTVTPTIFDEWLVLSGLK